MRVGQIGYLLTLDSFSGEMVEIGLEAVGGGYEFRQRWQGFYEFVDLSLLFDAERKGVSAMIVGVLIRELYGCFRGLQCRKLIVLFVIFIDQLFTIYYLPSFLVTTIEEERTTWCFCVC